MIVTHRESEREAETQAEGEAGSLRGAWCGTRSGTLGSRPEPKADAQLLSHPGVPILNFFSSYNSLSLFLHHHFVESDFYLDYLSLPTGNTSTFASLYIIFHKVSEWSL